MPSCGCGKFIAYGFVVQHQEATVSSFFKKRAYIFIALGLSMSFIPGLGCDEAESVVLFDNQQPRVDS